MQAITLINNQAMGHGRAYNKLLCNTLRDPTIHGMLNKVHFQTT